MKKKPKSNPVSKTTAQNLEQRFDQGKNVLDYFDTANKIRGSKGGGKLPPSLDY
jgi:hypothetical protein